MTGTYDDRVTHTLVNADLSLHALAHHQGRPNHRSTLS